jgi:hypothetical protein
MNLVESVESAVQRLDLKEVQSQYFFQDEAVVIDSFIPEEELASIVGELEGLRSSMHRSHVPGVKKSSSVGRHVLDRTIPAIREMYQSGAMVDFLNRLTDRELHFCPEADPHTCTLYCYLDEGDYFGGHYDTNYYRGTRFTALLGLVNDTESKLVAELYKKDASRKNQVVEVSLKPGTLVVFNCHRLYHWVTPLGAEEERIVLAMEYVSDPRRSRFQAMFSNLKDAVIYFGFKETFNPR